MKNEFTLLRKGQLSSWPMVFLLMVLAAFGVSAQTVIVNYEAPNTSSTFSYFGNPIGGSTTIIANPNPGGINTSTNVGEFIKGANSEVWAGGFADPATALDFTVHANACIKVWFSQPGVLLFKTENPTNGSGTTWERLQTVATANQWVEVCFDGTLPDQGGGNSGPAIGRTFTRAVLFFDFGTSFPTNRTYYFDDLVMTGAAPPPSVGDITFSVDMDGYAGSFTNVFVSGTFNGWSQFGNPLSDPDGDNVWVGTVNDIPFGQIEFKFQVDGWAAEEILTAGSPCTVTNFGFTNRFHNVAGNAVLPSVCWASCSACGASGYCQTTVQHLGIPAEVPSAIKLTIANINATSMYVEIESANADPVDFLLITGGRGATISNQNTTVPGKISRTLTWAVAPANVTLNVLWSKASFGGNWQLSPAEITVPVSSSCPFPPPPVPVPPTFCDTLVQHLGLPSEVPSAIFLTISKINATTMVVQIESANGDPVDFLLVNGGSGATISAQDFSVPGKISRTLTWANPPTDVVLNVLWSKASFGGNWLLAAGDTTIPFDTVCPVAAVPTMGEWALFLFALIMVTMGVVAVLNLQARPSLATVGGAVSTTTKLRFPFEKANYTRALGHALGLAAIGFVFIFLVWGEIVLADMFGMGLSVLVAAYLIHLFFEAPDEA